MDEYWCHVALENQIVIAFASVKYIQRFSHCIEKIIEVYVFYL